MQVGICFQETCPSLGWVAAREAGCSFLLHTRNWVLLFRVLHRSRLRAPSYERMGRGQSPRQWRFTLDGEQSGKGQMKYQLMVNPVLTMTRVTLLRRGTGVSWSRSQSLAGVTVAVHSFSRPGIRPAASWASAPCLEVFWALIVSSESEGQKSLCVRGVFILEGKTYINEKK